MKNMKKTFVKAEGIKVDIKIKKTPAQKIRDYFNTPKWREMKKANLSVEYKPK